MFQKQFSFKTPIEYEGKMEQITQKTGLNIRETFMFMIDNFESLDGRSAEILEKENQKLREQLEVERQMFQKIIFENQKQTAILNQMLFAFLPPNTDYNALFPLRTHEFITKYEEISLNEMRRKTK